MSSLQRKIKEKRIEYFREINGRKIIIENVPAEVCEQCGEIYFKPEVVDELLKQLERPEKLVKTVAVSVYQFPA